MKEYEIKTAVLAKFNQIVVWNINWVFFCNLLGFECSFGGVFGRFLNLFLT